MKTTIQQRSKNLAQRLLNRELKRLKGVNAFGSAELKTIDMGINLESKVDEERELKIKQQAFKDQFFQKILNEEKNPKKGKSKRRGATP